MDKTVLKKFAIDTRQEIETRIKKKINLFYVDEEFRKDNRGDIIVLSNDKHTLTLTKEEDSNRDKLIRRIVELGYEQVVEEAAYTWFNRIIAIRYMEIHDYLPLTKDNQSLGIRVLSSKDNKLEPEILKFSNLSNPELDISFDRNNFEGLKSTDDKFKYIVSLICHKLSKLIPSVFGTSTDYIDLLIPNNMISKDSFLDKLIVQIPESYFREDDEIIGWLYQFYVSNNRESFRNKKIITKQEIPTLTQVFTPDWIVKYMVNNTLGRLLFNKNNSDLDYYIKNDDNEESNIDIENIRVLEPCCGSGHILVYIYDLLFKKYLDLGYTKKDISKYIFNNNLYGLEIDERAVQIASFLLIMKARKYDNTFFNENRFIAPKIFEIPDSKYIYDNDLNYIYSFELLSDDDKAELIKLINIFKYGKTIGSLIKIKDISFEKIDIAIEKMENSQASIFNINFFSYDFKQIKHMRDVAQILFDKYDVLITNPPYLGSASLESEPKKYLYDNYPNSKSDLFAMFMDTNLIKENGLTAIVNPDSWMFLSSFQKIREKILKDKFIINLIHIGPGAFDAAVQTCSFVIKNSNSDCSSCFINLVDDKNKELSLKEKIEKNEIYKINMDTFNKVVGIPFAYWINKHMINAFENKIGLVGEYAKSEGKNVTTNNSKYVLNSWEVNKNNIGTFGSKWVPCATGGLFRKWYGNLTNIIDWSIEARNFYKTNSSGRIIREEFWNLPGVTWGKFGTSVSNFRILPPEFMYQETAILQKKIEDTYFILALLNSKVSNEFLQAINPTINFQLQDICSIPLLKLDKDMKEQIIDLSKKCINISREDWDLNELSLDFKKNYLIMNNTSIRNAFKINKEIFDKRINELINIEEELNKIFINMYNFNSFMDDKVNLKEITLKQVNEKNDIKSLISYAVGCMFGRYSLDEEGIIFAGGKFDKTKYKLFIPDEDNIIPISDDENIYYNDDIVGKFKGFIKVAFGVDYLNENLDYIAEVLGKRGTESSEDTIRRYFVNDFYNDHLKTYQKRPIYWLFDSGKKNGFKCLIYLHRYDEQIVSKIRTKYLHNTIAIYQRNLQEIDYKLNNNELATADKRIIQNKKIELNSKITECNEYEEKVGNVANKMIKLDLDDGVAVNYAKFIDDNGKSILTIFK